jgi:hypothetical protein
VVLEHRTDLVGRLGPRRAGRGKLNFSEFDRPQEDADKSAEQTEDGDMPPGYYTRFGLHSSAALSDEEVAQLIAGFRATPGLSDD